MFLVDFLKLNCNVYQGLDQALFEVLESSTSIFHICKYKYKFKYSKYLEDFKYTKFFFQSSTSQVQVLW